MAGFGSPTQGSSNQKKKGKNKTKKKGGSGETAARWANKLKRVYGGTSAEEIAAGTEKRIGSMIVKSLDEPLRRSLELREIVQGFERKISGMEAEDIRQRFSKEELDHAIANRKAFDEHMEANHLVPEDLQVAMQRLTWDASADAKACKSVTGTMPATFKNRVAKASEMAYEALLNTNKDNDEDANDGMVLDIGCGYGVLVPFLKKAGFKAHQIHGIDLSSEMIGHAKTFYPEVASKGKFEAVDFLAETNNSNKYRAIVFCSALHDMPDLKSALLRSKNEFLDTEEAGSRLVIVHAQGASHVLNQHKQNSLLVPRGLPTKDELEEWLCGEEGGPVMKLVHEPAQPKSQGEIREGYLAVLETI
jgi:2-polyprenyl-3-methyl-5-hydroxy-6-metoxy-1,4-benzoquinol methylase